MTNELGPKRRRNDKNYSQSSQKARQSRVTRRTLGRRERRQNSECSIGEASCTDLREECHGIPDETADHYNLLTDIGWLDGSCRKEIGEAGKPLSSSCTTKYVNGGLKEFFEQMNSIASLVDGGCSSHFRSILRRSIAEKRSQLEKELGYKTKTTSEAGSCSINVTVNASVNDTPSSPRSALQQGSNKTASLCFESEKTARLFKCRLRGLAMKYNVDY